MDFNKVIIDEGEIHVDHSKLHFSQDFWLRQRNGDWELKYPVGPKHPEEGIN
jgi:hypothetical protein